MGRTAHADSLDLIDSIYLGIHEDGLQASLSRILDRYDADELLHELQSDGIMDSLMLSQNKLTGIQLSEKAREELTASMRPVILEVIWILEAYEAGENINV